MKTITISDELYNDLIDIAKEYVTQDKRHQAEPCMFDVHSLIHFLQQNIVIFEMQTIAKLLTELGKADHVN